MMLSGSSGERACCSACALGDGETPSSTSPTQTSRWRLAAILGGVALAAGAVFLAFKPAKPSRLYNDPRNDRKRTREIPVETMEDVVWGGRR